MILSSVKINTLSVKLTLLILLCNSDRTTPIIETRDMSNTEQPDQETRDRGTQDVENTKERATRAGRVVKKVDHLIESMAQRQLNIKSITNTLGRKSQSLLTLF